MNQNPETPSAVPDVKKRKSLYYGAYADFSETLKKEAVAESVALREVVDQMDAVCAACPVNPSEGKWEICKQCGTTWERRNGKLCGSRHLQGGSGRMCFPSREQWEAWRKRLAEWEQGAVSGLRDVQGPMALKEELAAANRDCFTAMEHLTNALDALRMVWKYWSARQPKDQQEVVRRILYPNQGRTTEEASSVPSATEVL